MKKTVSISLAGYAFTIEEDAFLKLSNYINALKKPLNSDELDEVIHDIELRMVEILTSRLKSRTVVNVEDVDALITHIGSPESFEDFDEKKHHQKDPETSKKQLFRDIERKKIAGVCGGLSHYFGVDVVIVRIIFLLLLLGTGFGFLVYLILWVAVPKAETTGDILTMKGKPVNFENIKDYSSQMAKEAYESANNLYSDNKSTLVRIGQAFVRIFSIFIGVISSIFAFSFLVLSFTYLFGKITINNSNYSFPDNIDFYLGDSTLSTAVMILGFISLFATALYFLLLAVRCFYSSLKSIFLRTSFLTAFASWLILSILLIVNVTKIFSQYDGEDMTKVNSEIVTNADTLYLSQNKIIVPEDYKHYVNDVYSDKKTVLKKAPNKVLVIKDSSIQTPYLQIISGGIGEQSTSDITVPVEIENNYIKFPNKYRFSYNSIWRNYKIKYVLYIPSKMTLVSDGEIKLNYNESTKHSEFDDDFELKIDRNSLNIKL